MYTIKFKFEEKEKQPVILENVEPGNSILEIALMNDIELHHNCGESVPAPPAIFMLKMEWITLRKSVIRKKTLLTGQSIQD